MKSKIVGLTLLSSLALGIAGCDDPKQEVQRCVDQNNVVIDEQQCETADHLKAQYANGQVPTPIPYWWYYHWIFGGNGGYTRGSVIYGGSMRPSIGFTSVRSTVIVNNGGRMPSASSGISRGGFGSIGSGYGSSGG